MSNPSFVSDYLPPVPQSVPQSVPRDSSPASAPLEALPPSMVDVDRYIKLYDAYVKIQNENFRLQRNIVLLEDAIQRASVKTKSRLEGDELKDAFVDLLLQSSLNLESIPDDVERKIYHFVLNQISTASTTVSCFRKLFFP